MTDIDFTPPQEPSGVLRGIMAVLLATILLTLFTATTLEPTFFTPGPIALGLVIVISYICAALTIAIRWRRARNAWELKVTSWMSRQGARMATVEDLLEAGRVKKDLPAQFAEASYVSRIERPLGDIYFTVTDGQPALFEVMGGSVRSVPTEAERRAELDTMTDDDRQAAAGLPFGLGQPNAGDGSRP